MEYDNARVLVTDQKLESIKDVMGIMEAASKAGGSLVIIAEDVTVRLAHMPSAQPTHCTCLLFAKSTRRAVQRLLRRLVGTASVDESGLLPWPRQPLLNMLPAVFSTKPLLHAAG